MNIRRVDGTEKNLKLIPCKDDLERLSITELKTYFALRYSEYRTSPELYKLHRVYDEKGTFHFVWIGMWNCIVWNSGNRKGYETVRDALSDAVSKGWSVAQIGFNCFDDIIRMME